MIFYFTGTGNSLYAASQIAKAQGDRTVSIARLMAQRNETFHYELGENELLGLVFPVFAWGPPQIVLDFIKNLDVTGKPYVFSLSTCEGEEGKTSKIIRQAFATKGFHLDSAFSLKMPNNYLKGSFNVDSKDVETRKLEAAELMLAEINEAISQRRKNLELTLPGKFAAVKTTLINPLFNRFARKTGSFFADDACTYCGTCEKVCPVHTIALLDSGKPVWGKDCTQCMACINRCPAGAIQYGKGTAQKGRYYHPDLARLESENEE